MYSGSHFCMKVVIRSISFSRKLNVPRGKRRGMRSLSRFKPGVGNKLTFIQLTYMSPPENKVALLMIVLESFQRDQ